MNPNRFITPRKKNDTGVWPEGYSTKGYKEDQFHEDMYDKSKSRKAKIYDYAPIRTSYGGDDLKEVLVDVNVNIKPAPRNQKWYKSSRKKLSYPREDWGFIQAINKKDAYNNPILLDENDWIPEASKKSTGDWWVDEHNGMRPIMSKPSIAIAPKSTGIKMF